MMYGLSKGTIGMCAGLSMVLIGGCAIPSATNRPLLEEHIQFIDLTHPFGADTIVWPTEQDFKLIIQAEGETTAGYYYASNRMELPEHGGTHLDAPIHFAKGKQALDQIPLERLVGASVRIDLSAACAADRDYRVTVQDLERWEALHGRIPNQAIILLQTGFGRYWAQRKDYLGTELRGADGVKALHFPGLHQDAAAWLIRERQVKAVGIDTASIDYGQSTGFDTHVELLSHNVPVFENLADLSPLPADGFDVIALPMKIAGGTGGPLRIIAIIQSK